MTTIRIKITPEWAEEILAELPGGRELYMEIAEQFIKAYEAPEVVDSEEDAARAQPGGSNDGT